MMDQHMDIDLGQEHQACEVTSSQPAEQQHHWLAGPPSKAAPSMGVLANGKASLGQVGREALVTRAANGWHTKSPPAEEAPKYLTEIVEAKPEAERPIDDASTNPLASLLGERCGKYANPAH